VYLVDDRCFTLGATVSSLFNHLNVNPRAFGDDWLAGLMMKELYNEHTKENLDSEEGLVCTRLFGYKTTNSVYCGLIELALSFEEIDNTLAMLFPVAYLIQLCPWGLEYD